MMRKLFIILGIAVLLLAVWLLGPRPETPEYSNKLPQTNAQSKDIAGIVATRESAFAIKPGCSAQVLYALPDSAQTEYALLYLHGFSASHAEGYPTHLQVADALGANLYLSRLQEHGVVSDDPLLNFTAQELWNSALEALHHTAALGKKVVLMGTSTGGTLALRMAAEFPELVDGIILLSPNIEINNDAAWLLNDPWGLQMARLSFGSDFREVNPDSLYNLYWNGRYRLEAVTELQELVETAIGPEVYGNVRQPVFLGYYYRNEAAQDEVVRVDAMLEMFPQLATPDSLKLAIAYPQAEAHVIGNARYSKAQDALAKDVLKFCSIHFKKSALASDNSIPTEDLQE